jgi:predicted negative regulator of RcsB-dependent stress response
MGIQEGVFIFIFAVVAIVTFFGFQKWQDKWKSKMSKEDIDDLGL